jgi:Poxvirus D5 protein-like
MSRVKRDFILNNLHNYERIEEARGDTAIAGEPVRYFVDLCLRPEKDAEKEHSYQLHSWYEAFCSAHGYQRMSMSRFVSHLKTILPGHYSPAKRAKSDGSGARTMTPPHWFSLTLSDDRIFEAVDNTEFFRCIKKHCQSGGLYQFSDYANEQINSEGLFDSEDFVSKNGSDGSVTFGKRIIVSDPSDPSMQQGFQNFGSDGSDGSDTFSPRISTVNLCDRNHRLPVTSVTEDRSLFEPPSLSDPSDPSDPKV